MKPLILVPGKLTLAQIVHFYNEMPAIHLQSAAKTKITDAREVLEKHIHKKKIIYGVNTGFGKFANTVISEDKLFEIQHNLIVSHAVGTGPLLSDKIIRLIFLLKINSLAQGYSGVRLELIEKLIEHYNAGIIPCVPSKGSVGASGDLAPLAHFTLPLIGEGEVWLNNTLMPAKEALKIAKISPLQLFPKEGLAMINGLQISVALALEGLIHAEYLFDAAICAGALSTIATGGSRDPFDERVIGLLHSKGASHVAKELYALIHEGTIAKKVQDPYSLRCQPQVMGACLDQLTHSKLILSEAINAITDNPLVFAEEDIILSGGNFHGQNISMASDVLAMVIATIGNISERRIALLMDPVFSHLPAFLVKQGGENSGLMMLQVTAAALASENKMYAHPASIDTIPTSNNQEDHVSMATFSARRLDVLLDNAMSIIAIELIAACQAMDLSANSKLSTTLLSYYERVRRGVLFYEQDRSLSSAIEKVKEQIRQGSFTAL